MRRAGTRKCLEQESRRKCGELARENVWRAGEQVKMWRAGERKGVESRLKCGELASWRAGVRRVWRAAEQARENVASWHAKMFGAGEQARMWRGGARRCVESRRAGENVASGRAKGCEEQAKMGRAGELACWHAKGVESSRAGTRKCGELARENVWSRRAGENVASWHAKMFGEQASRRKCGELASERVWRAG